MDMIKGSRKSHTKTRTGCRNCKRRKIKCGEERPACKNCTKHSVRCDFTSLQLSSGRSEEAKRSPYDQTTSDQISNDQECISDHQRSSWPPQSDERSPSLYMLDLELLHNFSTSTCFTLSSNTLLKNLWRITVPQLGFKHDFVMRGILAVSAPHLAHSNLEMRHHYFVQAAFHHQTALDVAMSILADVTEDNCSSLYVFSVLTCIFALASPRKPGDFLLLGESGIAEWLCLLRGTQSIMTLASKSLENNALAPIISSGKRRTEQHSVVYRTNEQKHLDDLRRFINETVDERTAQIYATSIDELERSYAVASIVNTEVYELTDAFIWPCCLSDEYLVLLKQLAPEALAVFAHFCVSLKLLDSHWWMQGWSTHLISHIYSLLDAEHRLWIQWPIEQIGWVPGR